MPEGHDTIIEVSNIMSFVLYTQILKQSVLKPASPGITLMVLFRDLSGLRKVRPHLIVLGFQNNCIYVEKVL